MLEILHYNVDVVPIPGACHSAHLDDVGVAEASEDGDLTKRGDGEVFPFHQFQFLDCDHLA